jgi:hypothetical protein
MMQCWRVFRCRDRQNVDTRDRIAWVSRSGRKGEGGGRKIDQTYDMMVEPSVNRRDDVSGLSSNRYHTLTSRIPHAHYYASVCEILYFSWSPPSTDQHPLPCSLYRNPRVLPPNVATGIPKWDPDVRRVDGLDCVYPKSHSSRFHSVAPLINHSSSSIIPRKKTLFVVNNGRVASASEKRNAGGAKMVLCLCLCGLDDEHRFPWLL